MLHLVNRVRNEGRLLNPLLLILMLLKLLMLWMLLKLLWMLRKLLRMFPKLLMLRMLLLRMLLNLMMLLELLRMLLLRWRWTSINMGYLMNKGGILHLQLLRGSSGKNLSLGMQMFPGNDLN